MTWIQPPQQLPPYQLPPPQDINVHHHGNGLLSGLSTGVGTGIGCCCLFPFLIVLGLVILAAIGAHSNTPSQQAMNGANLQQQTQQFQQTEPPPDPNAMNPNKY